MRVFYLVFLVSVFLLSGLSRSQPERLKAPGGKDYSESRRAVHYFVVVVIAAVSGWYSAVQLKRDFRSLKKRGANKRHKQRSNP